MIGGITLPLKVKLDYLWSLMRGKGRIYSPFYEEREPLAPIQQLGAILKNASSKAYWLQADPIKGQDGMYTVVRFDQTKTVKEGQRVQKTLAKAQLSGAFNKAQLRQMGEDLSDSILARKPREWRIASFDGMAKSLFN